MASLWEGVNHLCFGCSEDNPIGLHLAFRQVDEELRASFQLSELHASYPGIAHGGIVTTVLDEVMGNAVALRRGRLAFTVSLRVRFLAPVRVLMKCEVRARIAGESGRLYHVDAEILDERAQPLAMASGSYRAMSAKEAARDMDVERSRLAGIGDYFHRMD